MQQPTIQASNHRLKKECTSDDSSLMWSEHAEIVLTPSGKDFSLVAQNSLIGAIICKGITSLTDELVLCQAWPDAGICSAYGRKLILGACDELMQDSPKIKDIKRWIKQEEDFADKLGELVSNSPLSFVFLICLPHTQTVSQLSTLRAPAKEFGDRCVPYYKLRLRKECIDHVEALSAKHTYVFPGTWSGTDGNISFATLIHWTFTTTLL